MRSLFLVVLLCTSHFASAQKKAATVGLNKEWSLSIQKKADSLVNAEHLPGIFIGTFLKDQVEYHTAGYADTASRGGFTEHTITEIGSITKTFTAYVLLKVLQSKNISDKESIYRFLPDSLKTNENLKQITFLSLMNHTSGLPRMPDNISQTLLSPFQPYQNYTINHLNSYLLRLKPDTSRKVSYSNTGAALAGILAAQISNQSYQDLLQKYFYKPLGIHQYAKPELVKATGYFNRAATSFWAWDVMAPAGAITLSGNDLLRYLQFMSAKKVDEPGIMDMLTESSENINQQVSVARGWHILQQSGKQPIHWHNGGTYGFSTFAAFLKGKDRGVFVIVNAFNKNSVADKLGFFIMKMLRDAE